MNDGSQCSLLSQTAKMAVSTFGQVDELDKIDSLEKFEVFKSFNNFSLIQELISQ